MATTSRASTRQASISKNNADTGLSSRDRQSALNAAGARKADAAKKRYIRTAEGARRYGGSIGDVIGTAKIKKGETLSELAKEYYGDASKWKLIAKASGIKDEKKIPVGTKLVFPPDPDDPEGNARRRKAARSGGSTGSSRADAARDDAKTYDDSDSVDLEATYYAPKNMSLEDIVKKFYGDEEKLEEVLRVNGLKKGEKILEGQSLILPGLDPDSIYPSKTKREREKRRSDRKLKAKSPAKSPGGARQVSSSSGFVLYADGAIYSPFGWARKATTEKPKK